MAKGNIGNLLQHFVALRSAQALLANWNMPDEPVLYIDCFSMAPWETVTGKQPQGFVSLINQFGTKANCGDLVAKAFLSAREAKYQLSHVPARSLDREYPNTAVLLRAAFPSQSWQMRLHDVLDENRLALEEWAGEQSAGEYAIEGNHLRSPLVIDNPVPPERPVFVMLDPYQIISDDHLKASENGYLTSQNIKALFGQFKLNLMRRPSQPASAPALITLFSYSDASPAKTHKIVSEHFSPAGWSIESVSSGPWSHRGTPTYHLGWVVSYGVTSPILGESLQSTWNEWSG